MITTLLCFEGFSAAAPPLAVRGPVMSAAATYRVSDRTSGRSNRTGPEINSREELEKGREKVALATKAVATSGAAKKMRGMGCLVKAFVEKGRSKGVICRRASMYRKGVPPREKRRVTNS